MTRGEAREALELVLGERLGGEEVERGRLRLGEQPLQHRHVVAEAFPARGPRHHHGVEPAAQRLDRLHLVGVKAGDAAVLERLAERLGERIGKLSVACRPRRQDFPVPQRPAVLGTAGKIGKPGGEDGFRFR